MPYETSYLTNTQGESAQVRPMDLDDDGAVRFTMPCDGYVCASAQVEVLSGTASAFVLTVIVSNDPNGATFQNHPSNITLTASYLITPTFSIAGYRWFGVKLTTINSGDTQANIYLNCSMAPAA